MRNLEGNCSRHLATDRLRTNQTTTKGEAARLTLAGQFFAQQMQVEHVEHTVTNTTGYSLDVLGFSQVWSVLDGPVGAHKGAACVAIASNDAFLESSFDAFDVLDETVVRQPGRSMSSWWRGRCHRTFTPVVANRTACAELCRHRRQKMPAMTIVFNVVVGSSSELPFDHPTP